MEQDRLFKLRKQIDSVDRELAVLLEQRMSLVNEIADYKKKTQAQILDAGREQKVIENVLGAVNNDDFKPSIEAIFKNMMAVSRAYQAKQNEASETGTVDPNKQSHESTSKNCARSFALVGEKLSHSLSPQIHQKLFEKTGLKGSYKLMEIPSGELPSLIGKLKSEGFSGVNVTIPYKTDIMRFLDVISE
ncbi:MAG: chorismate mutase, partial [Clostridia bacterium]|nr:chorismate mutase [Clostridia bacterium]